MSILLFGGTIEGRLLAQWLSEQGIPVTLCVATEYGAELASDLPGVLVHTGRLDEAGMESLMGRGVIRVVDATHPYAAQVTEHIAAAAQAVALPYTRLVRDGDAQGDWRTVPDATAAAQALETLPGNVLLTTGSKDLDQYARPGLLERCWPRVLPSPDSLARCLDLGFPAGHVLCMQGPFSQELNAALIRQYEIKILVTKATGSAGGFWDKVHAAQATGCTLLVIDRPTREAGLSLEEVKTLIKGETT